MHNSFNIKAAMHWMYFCSSVHWWSKPFNCINSISRYIASQPWPFPSSLMVGFIASAKHKLDMSKLHYEMPDDVVPVGIQGLNILRQQRSLPDIFVDMNELEVLTLWFVLNFLYDLRVRVYIGFIYHALDFGKQKQQCFFLNLISVIV